MFASFLFVHLFCSWKTSINSSCFNILLVVVVVIIIIVIIIIINWLAFLNCVVYYYMYV